MTAPADGYDETTSGEDVYNCFRLLLGRLPQKEELPGHLSLVGKPLRDVVACYLNSLEFKNRHLIAEPEPELEIVEINGLRFYASANDLGVGKTILETKTYEPAVTQEILSVTKPGMSFVDIGANIGYFTALAASRVEKEGRVYAFEPFDSNVKLIYINTKENGLENVQIFPFALGDKIELSFYDNTFSNGCVSTLGGNAFEVLNRKIVLCMPMDRILPFDCHIDIIKIDVEGGEYTCLRGGENLIKRSKPIILSEFSPPALQSTSRVTGVDYLEYLVDLGYSISVLQPDRKIPCGKTDEVMGLYGKSGLDHIDIVAYPI